jgi:hypothetical protein
MVFTSTIELEFIIEIKASSEDEYIKKLKSKFEDDYNIKLAADEIINIQNSDIQEYKESEVE